MTPSAEDLFRLCLILALVFACFGCAEFRAGVAENSAQAAQAKYETSVWEHCNTQTSGQLLRMGVQERQEFLDYCLRVKQ